MSCNLNVVSRQRFVVGTVPATKGMLTNKGVIHNVTDSGSVVIDNKNGTYSTFKKTSEITCRHSEAFKFGYPNANGCTREQKVVVRRGEERISA